MIRSRLAVWAQGTVISIAMDHTELVGITLGRARWDGGTALPAGSIDTGGGAPASHAHSRVHSNNDAAVEGRAHEWT